MPKRFLIIANPISGMGLGRKNAPKLEAELRERGHSVTVYFTKAAGDARIEAARIQPGEYDAIISVGGDGTLNEIVNGIGDKQIPVTVFPTGTGNVLAKEYKIPYNIKRVADMAERGKAVLFDVGSLEISRPDGGASRERRFILFVGCGFDAAVAEALYKRRKGSITMLSYLRPVLRVLFGYKLKKISITVDGKPDDASNLLISNVKNYGGPIHITRDADPSDGKLDICLMKARGKWDLIRFFIGALVGRLQYVRRVTYVRGSEIELLTEGVALQSDGDYVGHTPAKIKLMQGHLPVIVP